jgi:hypothetical protein
LTRPLRTAHRRIWWILPFALLALVIASYWVSPQ